MRKFMAVMLGGALLAAGAMAGGEQTAKQCSQMSEEQCTAMRTQMVDKKLGVLTQNLSLSGDQQGQVKKILAEEMAKKCSHGDKKAGEPSSENMKARVREVLTADQQAKFDKMNAGNKEGAGNMAGQTKGEKGAACCPH